MKIFLDTYALIEFLEGTSKGAKIKERLDSGDVPCTSLFNLYEVKYRMWNKIGKSEAEQGINLINSFTAILPITFESVMQAAEIKKYNSKLGAIDCNSYAIALQHKLEFITGDIDFKGMKNAVII